jgi:thymidylate synthase ThyX
MKLFLGGYNVDADFLEKINTDVTGFNQALMDALESRGVVIGKFETDDDKRNFIDENLSVLTEKERIDLLMEANGLIGFIFDHKEGLTPEPLAAAYARTSRLPEAINELRIDARLNPDKASRSVENIVGVYGHSSIAEHIVANMDVIDGSRFLMEFLERMRLAAYTEKSGRYQLFKDDFIRPKEIVDAGLLEPFEELQRAQISFYHKLYERLFDFQCSLGSNQNLVKQMNSDAEKKSDRLKAKKTLEGMAKEDARYISSLSMETQVGVTLNARQIEKAIARLSSSQLAENRELAFLMHNAVNSIMPSAIKYSGPTDFFRRTRPDLEQMTDEYLSGIGQTTENNCKFVARKENVTLIDYDPETENKILAAIMHSSQGSTGLLGSTLSYSALLDIVGNMADENKREFFRKSFRYMKSHDAVLREFEHASMKWELIVDASEFAQLKRHRMGTQTYPINFDPSLGITIPQPIIEIGMEQEFRDIAEGRTLDFYRKVEKETSKLVANYVLTNSMRRRVIYEMNPREAYHFSRMREDGHAQWKIRRTANIMGDMLRQKLPLVCTLLCGKDEFEEAKLSRL